MQGMQDIKGENKELPSRESEPSGILSSSLLIIDGFASPTSIQ